MTSGETLIMMFKRCEGFYKGISEITLFTTSGKTLIMMYKNVSDFRVYIDYNLR